MSDTILYVDDDEANLLVLEAACGRDFPIVTAHDGEQALSILREREVAVLLSDQRMPGMSGVELFERVQREYPHVVRVLISGYSDFQDATSAINRGHVHRFLKKPWVAEELKANLREALELYRNARKIKLLEQRLRETERVYALGVVAGGIAHELRNPIAAVATSLSLLRDGLSTLSSTLGPGHPGLSTLQEMALTVVEARQGMQQITDITRGVELSQRKRDSEDSADLSEVVRLTLTSLNGELRQHALLEQTVEVVPPVRGARAKLGQIVLNLMVNAMQSLPERPRTQNKVRVSLRREGQHARFEVEDNGRHSPHGQDLFDARSEGIEATSRALGLAISRQIAEELGGKLNVISGTSGVCFTALFPFAKSDKESAA